jgi:hypothetical protein
VAPTELDALLQALEEPQADATLPPGWKWGRLADAGIAGPIATMKMVKQRNTLVSVPTPESVRLAREVKTLRWPVLDTRDPDAVGIWQQHALAVQEYQRSLKPAPRVTMAEPAGDGGMTSRILVVRR